MKIVILKFKDGDEITCPITERVLEYWQGEAKKALAKYAKIISIDGVLLEATN